MNASKQLIEALSDEKLISIFDANTANGMREMTVERFISTFREAENELQKKIDELDKSNIDKETRINFQVDTNEKLLDTIKELKKERDAYYDELLEKRKEAVELESAFQGVLHDVSHTDQEIRELLSQVYPDLDEVDEKVPTLEYGVEKLVNDYLALQKSTVEIIKSVETTKNNLNSLETFEEDGVYYVTQESVLNAVKEIL